MGSFEELLKRSNEAGIRLLQIQIEAASSLLDELETARRQGRRTRRRMAEVHIIVDRAKLFAQRLTLGDAKNAEVSKALHELEIRVEQSLAAESAAPL